MAFVTRSTWGMVGLRPDGAGLFANLTNWHIQGIGSWKKPNTIVIVTCERMVGTQVSTEFRYYISSLEDGTTITCSKPSLNRMRLPWATFKTKQVC